MTAPKNARSRTRSKQTREGEREGERERTPEMEGSPRTGAKRTVMGYISDLPRFLRLLWGLVTDSRVAMLDKVLVAGAIAYIVMPLDLIPDYIPFLGEVDDVFLLVLALRRLLQNAGRSVVLSHWSGDAADLHDLNLRKALLAATFFLPRGVRRRLRVLGKG
jgi:uncharacterized membrane protein YkvA (DUF1232 family)